MNEQTGEKRLDELISHTINTAKPQFDAERWKQKYHDELEILRSRAAKGAPTRARTAWRVILGKPIIRLAAAAVIIVAIGSFIVQRDQRKQERPRAADAAKSPAEMMTTMSLERAFQRGGIEAVEEQYSEAFKLLGPRPGSLSVEQILAEFNGT